MQGAKDHETKQILAPASKNPGPFGKSRYMECRDEEILAWGGDMGGGYLN